MEFGVVGLGDGVMESWKIEFGKWTWDSGDYREGSRRSFSEKVVAWGSGAGKAFQPIFF